MCAGPDIEFQKAGHIWAYIGGQRECMKSCPMWAGHDREFHQVCHILVYVDEGKGELQQPHPIASGQDIEFAPCDIRYQFKI